MEDKCYPWQQNIADIEKMAYMSGYEMIGGIDEAGRGPLAGPVVASVVILPQGLVIPGINDSKKLTPQQRERLYKIISTAAIDWGVGIVEPEVIDQVNILQATYMAMRQAVAKLRVNPRLLLVDGNLSVPDVEIPQYPVPRGDTFVASIQAASIISKVIRDKIMVEYDAIYPEYGFAKHKGYGTELHLQAIEQHGACGIHRTTYAPVRELLSRQVLVNKRKRRPQRLEVVPN
ncbi:ribonuclease HII [bacterium]|nr:ribonuclease HII [bacterium]MBU1754277.1 ribonuclease HII [bacterium]